MLRKRMTVWCVIGMLVLVLFGGTVFAQEADETEGDNGTAAVQSEAVTAADGEETGQAVADSPVIFEQGESDPYAVEQEADAGTSEEGLTDQSSMMSGNYFMQRTFGDVRTMLNRINEERAKVGVAPVVLDSELVNAAMIRSGEFAVRQSFTRPNGQAVQTVSGKISKECLAFGYNVDSVMKVWMESDYNKAIILNPDLHSLGVGSMGSAFYALEFGTAAGDGGGSQPTGEVIAVQKIDFLPEFFSRYELRTEAGATSQVLIGKTADVQVVTFFKTGVGLTNSVDRVTSSDSSVVSASKITADSRDMLRLTGGKVGNVTLTIQSGSTSIQQNFSCVQPDMVTYQTHVQNIGWQDAVADGEESGTDGQALRLEGIKIQKGEDLPDGDIEYQTHVENVGWQTPVGDGELSGTSGQALRLEGIKISKGSGRPDGDIEYQTHVESIGWQDWVKNGAMSGTSGRALRLEAIRIRLTGQLAAKYDVYYRVHCENYGWLGWAKNGEMAGTSEHAFRLEAIQIVLVAKGGAAPGSTARPSIQAFDRTEGDAMYRLNVERSRRGLMLMTGDQKLHNAAVIRAGEIVSRFSHTRPNGTSCFTAFSEQGVSYSAAGENIFGGSSDAQTALDMWMSSPGHRANILDTGFGRVGIAQTNGFWVQDFCD
jgi:uncharacterized protein YjdB